MFAKSGRKGNTRKRERKDSDEGEDDGGSAVVRKEKGPVKSALAATTVGQKKKGSDAIYESNRSVMPTIGVDKSATAPSAEELEDMMGDKRGQAGGAAGVADDGLYRGEANRQQLKEKREIINKAANSIGPIKAPTNVRMTCRFARLTPAISLHPIHPYLYASIRFYIHEVLSESTFSNDGL